MSCPPVLDLAGVPAPHRHFGRSLLPLLRDPAAPHRELAFTEGGFTVEEESRMEHAAFPYDLKSALQHEDPTVAGRAVAVRDREWTYVWRLYERPELYHRAEDPHECTNPAGRPEHAEVERRLHDAVLRWLVETSDVVPAAPDPRRPDVDLPALAHTARPAARRAPRPDAVERPERWLAGFATVTAGPGETVTTGIRLPERVFRFWDEGADGWSAVPGTYRVLAGRSATDTRLSAVVDVRAEGA
ncbi:fibronectin type III-like domain-contianing protein [Streptomyces sp. NPDC057963]|uniref:fibronectin type III-like domain-contianing protein n=1 Tax=Streptomyces sp. NPDC057963 TaxID=3346290 RepID=UPI0036E1745B